MQADRGGRGKIWRQFSPRNDATAILRQLLSLTRKPAKGLLAALALFGGFTAMSFAADRHADADLEALLPRSLGGAVLTVESQAGTELSTNSKAFDAFLSELGKTRGDFTIASAYSRGELKAAVGAWRVKGAVTERLVPGFQKAVQGSSTMPLAIARETIGGREVSRVGDPGQLTQGPLYVIARGDTLLFVQTPDRSLAEEAMTKLAK